MSIYIGKDNSNNNMLHITKGIVSEDSIKTGSILNNTIYNSKLPLSSYRLIPITNIFTRNYDDITGYDNGFSYNMVSTCFLGISGNNKKWLPVWEFKGYSISSSDYSFLITQLNTNPNRILFLDSDYSISDSIGLANIVSLTHYSSTYGQEYTTGFSTSYTFGLARFQYQTNINVRYILVLIDNFYPSLSGEILLNNNGLFIGGINTLANKNLITSFSSYGSTYITNGLYLTNTPTTSSGLELVTEPNIKIKIGNVDIFNSLYSSFMPFKSKTNIFNTILVPYSTSYTDTLIYTMKSTEDFSFIGIKNYFDFLIRNTYTVVTRDTNRKTLILCNRYYTSGSSLRTAFTYIYSLSGNVYARTIVLGGGISNFNLLITFNVESF